VRLPKRPAAKAAEMQSLLISCAKTAMAVPVAVLGIVLGFAQADAGDIAQRDVIGFSASGEQFAFEEYGIQDGSGFAYSNIYIIDVATDSWLPGTPVRIRLEDDTAGLETARAQAQSMAGSILDRFAVNAPPYHAASNPVTETSADPYHVTINPRPVLPAIDDPFSFTLVPYSLAGSETCAPFGPMKGFKLSVERLSETGNAVQVHKDTAIPQSRGCPLDYRIADIFTFFPDGGAPVFAALIQIIAVGFEGPDGRFMAVTGALPG
jgi:predicted secreted protein